MADLSQQLKNLSPKRRALLLQRLQRDEKKPSVPRIVLQGRESSVFPLSFAQRRLWFLEQLLPGTPAYNLFAILQLEGSLNVSALAQSLNEIVRRHEMLRTTFLAIDDDRPQQQISPELHLPLPLVDLQAMPEPEAIVNQLATAEAHRPFDLEQGPLLRTTLLRLSPKEHILLLTVHHIVSDGQSIGVFLREFSLLYAAFAHGEPSPLPALPLQYADFAVWQRQWLQGEVLERQMAYWKAQLVDLTTLQLPTDRPRPAVQSFRGANYLFRIDPPLVDALKELSLQEGATLFMTLLAAFQTLLGRYSGQDDIVVGAPIDNRRQPELEGLIGLFVNTLVLRSDLSGNPPFRALLARVREVCLEAYAHQDLPFERLVEELQPQRDLARNPLFQVTLTLQSTRRNTLELPGLMVDSLPLEEVAAKFDLSLTLNEEKNGLVGILEYNADLFDRTTMERLTGHFRVLLEGIVANPDRPLSALPLLTAAERQQLIVAWNDTRTTFARNTCVHSLFEAQAARTPDAVATVFGEAHVTYRMLNHRANQLAHTLQTLGVGPETVVGVYMERSLQMTVAILGVLKAGGAHLPLDLGYPQQRLAFMLADAQSPVLITQRALAPNLPDHDAKVVFLDGDMARIGRESRQNPAHQTTAASLAYVMYTSGSTGQPKGIGIPHRAINRLVLNTNYIQLRSDDRMAHVTNVSFDPTIFELWGALLHGACLVGFRQELLLAPQRFAEQLSTRKISVSFLATALFNEIVRAVPDAFRSLRCVLFGGEAAAPQWVKVVLETAPPEQLINVYGPTESTTFASWYRAQNVATDATTIPIGRPIANTQLYILDDQLQPVPVGVPGELYIGGEGLARGYLHRPKLTAASFIPNPFLSDERSMMNDEQEESDSFLLYRTGDLARYRPDGDIEFLGRIDQQVKIRSFRIELGEIETTLTQHPAVQDAVVLLWQDTKEDKQLVAYMVPDTPNMAAVQELHSPPYEEPADSESTPAADEERLLITSVQRFLRNRLPDYMVPSTYILLETIPLTANGKTNRRLLPPPERATFKRARNFVAPRNPIEEKVAELWSDALDVERIGIYDNFFDLGGHSLSAIRMISQIRQIYRIELPLKELFAEPTVASLARNIMRYQEEQGDDSLQAIGKSEAENESELLSDVDRLSDEEVDELLALLGGETEE